MTVPSITPPVERFHRVLIEEIARKRPDYLSRPFTVAEIYQSLVPYRSHRDAIGVQMNGDYEDALLRLLAGAGDLLILESQPALGEIRRELESRNPNTGLFREFAQTEVRLNAELLPESVAAPEAPSVAQHAPPAAPPIQAEAPPAEPAPVAQEAAPTPMPEAVPPVEPAPRPSAGNGLASEFLEAEIAPVMEEGPRMEDAPVLEAAAVGTVSSAPSGSKSRPGGEGGSATSPATGECLWCSEALPQRTVVNYCPHCGQSTKVKPCGGCGEEMELAWRYCVTCGAESRTGLAGG
ncbi:MAG: zinc ribbon domain-containing protein [Gemmatimonadota bacterium]